MPINKFKTSILASIVVFGVSGCEQASSAFEKIKTALFGQEKQTSNEPVILTEDEKFLLLEEKYALDFQPDEMSICRAYIALREQYEECLMNPETRKSLKLAQIERNIKDKAERVLDYNPDYLFKLPESDKDGAIPSPNIDEINTKSLYKTTSSLRVVGEASGTISAIVVANGSEIPLQSNLLTPRQRSFLLDICIVDSYREGLCHGDIYFRATGEGVETFSIELVGMDLFNMSEESILAKLSNENTAVQ
jgi:hypothetical protein